MPGVANEYVTARSVLLDALEALEDHLNAVILVGAQAIYLHTGRADLAVAEFTTDADLALDPALLGTTPALEQAMEGKGFTREQNQPGIWRSQRENVTVDLMVPEAVGGPGRRAARLEGHGPQAARKAKGLEAALVDHQVMNVAALDPADPRAFPVAVAGPSALLVAKLYKLAERQAAPRRLDDKDALDVYRLLKAIPTAVLAQGFAALLADPRSAEVTAQGETYLTDLFGTDTAAGTAMAGRAVIPLEDPAEVEAACVALANDLLQALA